MGEVYMKTVDEFDVLDRREKIFQNIFGVFAVFLWMIFITVFVIPLVVSMVALTVSEQLRGLTAASIPEMFLAGQSTSNMIASGIVVLMLWHVPKIFSWGKGFYLFLKIDFFAKHKLSAGKSGGKHAAEGSETGEKKRRFARFSLRKKKREKQTNDKAANDDKLDSEDKSTSESINDNDNDLRVNPFSGSRVD